MRKFNGATVAIECECSLSLSTHRVQCYFNLIGLNDRQKYQYCRKNAHHETGIEIPTLYRVRCAFVKIASATQVKPRRVDCKITAKID